MKAKEISVSLGLPFGLGSISGTWGPDENERLAAWEMYVELVTRVTVVELEPGRGLLREALTSLYSLFDTTRDILRRYGPTVATPSKGHNLSFGHIAVAILNGAIRPVLSKWHPELDQYESIRAATVSPVEHEQAWDKNEELRSELDDLRRTLVQYAVLLADVADIPPLVLDEVVER